MRITIVIVVREVQATLLLLTIAGQTRNRTAQVHGTTIHGITIAVITTTARQVLHTLLRQTATPAQVRGRTPAPAAVEEEEGIKP